MKKILIGLVLLLIAIRALAPSLILHNLNKFLADFSPVYFAHIEDFDLSIWRAAYQFEGLVVSLKENKVEFLKAEKIDVSMAWRELFRGQLVTDAVAEGAEFILTPELMKVDKRETDAANAKEKLFPLRIDRIDLRNSTFQYADLPALPEIERWRVTGVEGRISNLTPSEKNPKTLLSARGTLGSAGLKVFGQLNRVVTPIIWDTDIELQDLDLVKINALLKRKVPLTFTAGTLDAYAEIQSLNGRIEGYVKPFFKKVDVVEDAEHFLGLKHFGVELTVAAVNLILRNAKDKTLATKVLFAYEGGKFQLNSAKALSQAIAHGFGDIVNPGFDNQYDMEKP